MKWISFQNIYTFIYQKTLLHTILLLIFKSVKSLQCFLKVNLSGWKEYQISHTDYLAQTTSYNLTTKCELKKTTLKYDLKHFIKSYIDQTLKKSYLLWIVKIFPTTFYPNKGQINFHIFNIFFIKFYVHMYICKKAYLFSYLT